LKKPHFPCFSTVFIQLSPNNVCSAYHKVSTSLLIIHPLTLFDKKKTIDSRVPAVLANKGHDK